MTAADADLPCPHCDAPLTPLAGMQTCHGCHGLWVTEAEIAERLRARCLGAGGVAVFSDGDGPSLPCPACRIGMAPQVVEGVAVDRCQRHGVWFDADELERTLRAARARGTRMLQAARAPSMLATPATPARRRDNVDESVGQGLVVFEDVGDAVSGMVDPAGVASVVLEVLGQAALEAVGWVIDAVD